MENRPSSRVRGTGDTVRSARYTGTVVVLACLLGMLVAGGPAGASGIISGSLPLPAVIGQTDGEIREAWGAPRYIKVAPHDGDRRYAYFTLREWEQLGLLYPATQGEDVYVVEGAPLQVHVRYQPLFDARNRFSPRFRATTITYVFDEPTPLERVAEFLPLGDDGLRLGQAEWWSLASGGGRVVLVHWPSYEHPVVSELTPFRADPPVTFFWEVGLSVPTAEVNRETPVNYVIERLDQFRYDAGDLTPLANPYAE